ncbi:hypothetical protein HDN1F_35050 [gamma proteobacterium HdN1]|nr:Hypothetical protein HDN1F_18140 [gamma proteobacterium HdN1]CBL47088.1 hypothetical protein HDN1F_35050 [gamma proteobacterium HdN1]
MACSAVAGEPMLAAFQKGSGLCSAQLSVFVTAATFVPCVLLATWVVIAVYQRWSRDKDGGFEYLLTGVLGASFIGVAGIFFLR